MENEGNELWSKFKELFKESNVRNWCENLDTDWMRRPEDEEFLQTHLPNLVRTI